MLVIMKSFKNILKFAAIILIATSCQNANYSTTKKVINLPEISNQESVLQEFIQNGGDYINKKESPYLIDNDVVYANLSNYLILDIRQHDEYVKGHINGAINIEIKSLFKYLDKNPIGNYEKVIIVDNIGLQSSYISSVLRAAGYGNVFPMKEGMASWDKQFTHFWADNLTDKYASVVTSEGSPKAESIGYPTIKTNAKNAAEIAKLRAEEIIDDNPFVTAEDVMTNKSDFYIINYWPKENYDIAHLPGAVQYTPLKSLLPSADLKTIPTDKKIAVYCFTGNNASAVVAYLRLLGYDAYSIKFGVNSFMYSKAKINNWHPYIAAEKVKNFPLVKGEKPSDKAVNQAAVVSKKAAAAPIVAGKKKESAGGGCN